MNLNSIWSALEESSDILGDYAYPAMDKAAEEMNLRPIFSPGSRRGRVSVNPSWQNWRVSRIN